MIACTYASKRTEPQVLSAASVEIEEASMCSPLRQLSDPRGRTGPSCTVIPPLYVPLPLRLRLRYCTSDPCSTWASRCLQRMGARALRVTKVSPRRGLSWLKRMPLTAYIPYASR